MKVTIDDVRKAGHCVAGARRWFDAHGLDFRKFLKEGIPVEDFLASGDALAQQVVDRKLTREQGNERRR